jgi:hypothetical protein
MMFIEDIGKLFVCFVLYLRKQNQAYRDLWKITGMS